MHYNTMFALPYFALILFGISQVSLGQFKFPPPAGFEKNFDLGFMKPETLPYPDPNCKTVVIPQNNPTSGSIFANVPSVAIFTNKFLKTVYSTDILREVYDFSKAPAKQFVVAGTQKAEEILSEVGVKNTAAITEFLMRAVKLYYDVLTLPIAANHFVNIVANSLFVFGVLDVNNAEFLASEYVQTVIRCAKIPMDPTDPASIFKPALQGFKDFMKSQGMLTKERAPIVFYYAGNDFFLQAVENGLV